MKLLGKAINIGSLVLVLLLVGCACEPISTDSGSAAVLQSERQNIEFQQKGVPRKGPSMQYP